MFRIRKSALAIAVTSMIAALAVRAVSVVAGLRVGDAAPLLALPFTALLPGVLLSILAMMPPTRTREGLLMRVGTMIQLLLIVALPGVALYLALGFPVVFLLVELFETRLAPSVRDPLLRLMLA